MDTTAHERHRPALHGLVTPRRLLGAALVAGVALAVIAGVFGGLLRAGIAWNALADTAWLPRAGVAHAALMVCGFMGSVIGIERAVAARSRTAWLAPVASASAGVLLLAGADPVARGLLVAASLLFVGVNASLVRRQRAAHTALLFASACAWCVGNVLFALDAAGTAVLPWWFAFLVMTVGAERLEMTRLMRDRPGARPALVAVLAALLAGAAASFAWPAFGGVVFGLSLAALAGWLLAFDIARRTVHARGLPRYMAVCLLAGYGWLAVGGLAWAATAAGLPARDLALHAVALGFLVSMIMGHAPVILPAVARVKLAFGNFFYLPLAALHLSLLLRLGGAFLDPRWRATGALLNALALAFFAATVVGAALAWRRRYAIRNTPAR